MEFRKIKAKKTDERGVIKDILYNEPIDHVTVITSDKGAVRGNHFHKETIQWVYCYSGKLKSLTQKGEEKVVCKILEEGDLLKTEKNEKHALQALEKAVFFVFTKGPRGGDDYEDDTYRLKTPLRDEISNE